MGRRSEQRIAISIPVVVRGADSRGNPYAVNAETSDISVSGARLFWPDDAITPERKVEIEYRGKKAWFQIQWVGKAGTDRSERVGVRCLEPSKCIWDVQPKKWEPDTYDPSNVCSSSWESFPMKPLDYSLPGKERRQFPRRVCALEGELTADGYSVGIPVKITDISLGGCYIEMFSPLPKNSLVELSLKLDGVLHVSGKVRSSQTGFGMGIAFTSMSPDDFEKLKTFAPTAPNAPASAKLTSLSPSQHVARSAGPEFHLDHSSLAPEALEALVRVLCRKGLLTTAGSVGRKLRS